MKLLRRGTLALAFGGLLALSGAGCGGSAAPVQTPAALFKGSNNQPQFLNQIADAPFQNAYYARRHVWQSYQEANGPQTLEYTEEVWSDGLGHFSVTPEHLIHPALPAQGEQIFLLMQKAREGFIYRLRDFRIRDLGEFLQGYTVEDLGRHETIAGQDCESLRIRSIQASPTYWEFEVLPANGLILATREYTAQGGALVSSVETTEYQANPNLAAVNLHQDLPATAFTPATEQQVLGFHALQPGFLPQGFTLTKSEKVSQGSEAWARFGYSDGADTLFVLYRRLPLSGTQTGDPGNPYTIKIFRVGRWTVAQASFGRHVIIAMGQQPATVMQQIVESSAP